jgi:hypothetical protein
VNTEREVLFQNRIFHFTGYCPEPGKMRRNDMKEIASLLRDLEAPR